MNIRSYTSTLIKAFDILDCFADDSQELGIKEIALRIDMPQSSVYRILQSLDFGGLIYQNKENKKYRLGPKFSVYANKCPVIDSCRAIACKYMEILNRETNETVNLAILDCDKIIYAHRVECSHVLRPNFTLKAAYPAYKTGLGMVLIADLSDAGVQWIYQNNADDIGMSQEEFSAAVEQVRRDGCAFDDQVFCEGLRCVAAPIRGPGGKALFSVSISAPTLRMDDATYERTRQLVVKYAERASREIREL